MPNWCDNSVTITGPNSVIDKIEKIVKEENSDNGLLNFMFPMPAELKDTTADGKKNEYMEKKYGHSDWYTWACDSWGTKWEISEFHGMDRQYLTEQNEGESTITFGFQSAWSPPIGAYENFLSENEECSLKAYYYEGGCDFMGVWDNGDDICEQPSSYNSQSDFWTNGLGQDLDDLFNITEPMAEWEQERMDEGAIKVKNYVNGEPQNVKEDA